MAKFYTLSPESVPENQVLFPTIRPYFISQGHCFVDLIEEADVVLFDLHSRIGGYSEKDIEFICLGGVPVATFDEWDRGNMSADIWPFPLTRQQEEVSEALIKHKVRTVHFCRLLDKTKEPYNNIFPYEKPILYEEPFLTPDDLFNRPLDICFISNSSPSREKIAQALIEDGRLKCHISLGAEKIPFDDFVKEHKKAKLFLSSGAGGYSNERPQHLFSIAAILQERTDQLLLHPYTHLYNCLMIDSPPTKEDIDTIVEVVNDKERLYGIYKAGYEFMKQNYSAEAVASDILQKILKHLQ